MKKTVLAAAVIFFLALAAYSNSFTAGFHFDDFHQVVRNPKMVPANILKFFTDASLSSVYADSKGYRPLTFATLALNYGISGLHVWSYHAVNFLLHFLNAFLLFTILRMLMRRRGREDSAVPLAASLIFALHPIQTQAVTYILSRSVLLATSFYLLALLAFIEYRERPGGGARKAALAALPPLLYVLGLLSKEMAVSLPAVLFLYDLIIYAPQNGGIRKNTGKLIYYILFIAALACFLLYRRHLQGYVIEPHSDVTTTTYLITEAKAFLVYLRLLVFPFNQIADYYRPFTFRPDALSVAGALTAAALAALALSLRKRQPVAAFFMLWFLVALAPESSLVPIPDNLVEYRLYLPSAGLFAAFAVLASRALKGFAYRRQAAAVALALLGVLTFNRNFAWADEQTLWHDVLRKVPGSPRAHGNIAADLMEHRRYADAIKELDTALDTMPMVLSETKDGLVLLDQRNIYFENLGICYRELGRLNRAIGYFHQAISIKPRQREYYMELANALYMKGDFNGALDTLGEVVSMYPNYTQAYFDMAQNFLALKAPEKAVLTLTEAMRRAPEDYDAHYNLATVYVSMGEGGKARDEARAALSVASDYAQRRDAKRLLGSLESGTEAE